MSKKRRRETINSREHTDGQQRGGEGKKECNCCDEKNKIKYKAVHAVWLWREGGPGQLFLKVSQCLCPSVGCPSCLLLVTLAPLFHFFCFLSVQFIIWTQSTNTFCLEAETLPDKAEALWPRPQHHCCVLVVRPCKLLPVHLCACVYIKNDNPAS